MANRIDVMPVDSVKSNKAWLRIVLLCSVVASVGGALAIGTKPWAPGELTGRVLDASTQQPLEGAYVIASYRKAVSGMAASNSWCVKTRGMYTGADGQFRFPIEKLDGQSPFTVEAIKPGYYFKDIKIPTPAAWRRQGVEAYTGRDIILAKQDPGKTSFQFSASGDEFCTRATSRTDVDPAIQFLEIKVTELKRLGATQDRIDSANDLIKTLQLTGSASQR